ncbi:MAG: hypothetical protein LBD77_08145 [Bifidobacteriaceae bacterium]|jgi:hypothetical protein|nr:hypothetical protein [Bifidobacteriaceae bacterium]
MNATAPVPQVAEFVMRPVPPDGRLAQDGRLEKIDIYDLPATDLGRYSGLIFGISVDQRFLGGQRPSLEGWVKAGGRLLMNGHPVAPFLEGMPQWRKLHFHGVDDIWLTALEPHPIWDGLDRRDILLRTGVPGRHSFEELLRIGVGGFYARSYMVGLPDAARSITGIGPGKLPVDVSYPLGAGEVIVHAGNELLGFDTPGTSAEGLANRVMTYLEGGVL